MLSEANVDQIDDPFDSFSGENPVIKKARAAKTKMEEHVKALTLSVDNHREALESAKAELSATDGELGTLSARIKMAKQFLHKAVRSTTEEAFVKAIPGLTKKSLAHLF